MIEAEEKIEYILKMKLQKRAKLHKKLGGFQQIPVLQRFLEENKDDKIIAKAMEDKKKLFDELDALESKIAEMGFVLEDSNGGTTWRHK